MAREQLLYDLWWEDRKQMQWFWLHWKICIAWKVRASVFPRAFFLALAETIQIPKIHNNLAHWFMEKQGSGI